MLLIIFWVNFLCLLLTKKSWLVTILVSCSCRKKGGTHWRKKSFKNIVWNGLAFPLKHFTFTTQDFKDRVDHRFLIIFALKYFWKISPNLGNFRIFSSTYSQTFANDHLQTVTTILGSHLRFSKHLWTTTPYQQRHNFRIPSPRLCTCLTVLVKQIMPTPKSTECIKYSESRLMLSLVNVISRLIWSHFEIPFTLTYYLKISGYCYHSVNVITFCLAQSDHIKRLLLYISKSLE